MRIVQGLASQQVQDEPRRLAPQHHRVLMDGGHVLDFGERVVVKADERHLFGHLDMLPAQLVEDVDRHLVGLHAYAGGSLRCCEQRRNIALGDLGRLAELVGLVRRGDVEVVFAVSEFQGGFVEALAAQVGAVVQVGRDEIADVGQPLVPQRMQELNGLTHAFDVIDADRGVQPLHVRVVDADQRHVQRGECGSECGVERERGDDDGIDVTVAGQRLDELGEFGAVGDERGDDVVPFGGEDLDGSLQDRRVEPVVESAGDQQQDTMRFAGGER